MFTKLTIFTSAPHHHLTHYQTHHQNRCYGHHQTKKYNNTSLYTNIYATQYTPRTQKKNDKLFGGEARGGWPLLCFWRAIMFDGGGRPPTIMHSLRFMYLPLLQINYMSLITFSFDTETESLL